MRSALSTLRSTRQMLCQVPRASRPPTHGHRRVRRDDRGHHVRPAVPRRPVPVPPAVVGGQQVPQRAQQVVVAARAGLDDRDAGRGVRDEERQQPVAAARPRTRRSHGSGRARPRGRRCGTHASSTPWSRPCHERCHAWWTSSPSHLARSAISASTAVRTSLVERLVLVDARPPAAPRPSGRRSRRASRPAGRRAGPAARSSPTGAWRRACTSRGSTRTRTAPRSACGRRPAGRTATAGPSGRRSPASRCAGSTRHSPLTPSTAAGSPAWPTPLGSGDPVAGILARAMPSAASRRRRGCRRASSTSGTGSSG